MVASSLIDELRWLPVITDDGAEQHGVLDVLLNAHRITSIVTDVPTQHPAILRQVLLPVVIDALGLPATEAEWLDRFSAGAFTADERQRITRYLDDHRAKFDLFAERAPFAQVGDLRSDKGQVKGASLIVATAATGNNVPLFATRTEAEPPALTPEQAARWLLHTQCWDTAAIKTGAVGDITAKAGKTTGNPTGPLGRLGVVVPVGRTLYDTLLLNTPVGLSGKQGLPQWAQDPPGASWKAGTPATLLELLTWQSRRIRLFPEETADGLRVRQALVCAGDRMQSTPGWEPHTTWSYRKAGRGLVERVPRRLRPGRAIWRGLDALLTLEAHEDGSSETSPLLNQLANLRDQLPADYPLRVETFGVLYGTQSAVIEDSMHDAMPLAVPALADDSIEHAILLTVSRQAEELATAVNRLSADLRRAAGADPIPWDKGQRPGELVLHALDPLVRRVLAGVRRDAGDAERLDAGELAWEQLAARTTWEVADRLFRAQPASSFLGRAVEQNGREVVYRPGTADAVFRRRVDEILSRAAEARRAKGA